MQKFFVMVGILGLLAMPAMGHYTFSPFTVTDVGQTAQFNALAGAPAGTYYGYEVSLDWSTTGTYCWSSEARIGMDNDTASPYYHLEDPGASPDASGNNNPVTLTWAGALDKEYFGGGDPLNFVSLHQYDEQNGAITYGDVTVKLLADNPDIYTENMDSDPGWSTEAEWAFGVPTGGGSFPGDPTSGATGSNVYGYNLDGDYADNMATTEYLTTTAYDFTGYTDVGLKFQRWLGVESSSYDHACIEVSINGTDWTSVWANPGSNIREDEWGTQRYDISGVADGQSTVYVRWGMGTTDGSGTYNGWNIDDVAFTGVPEPTTLVLFGIGGLALLRRRR